jgi:transcriptional regulator with XRE-family HTH domain
MRASTPEMLARMLRDRRRQLGLTQAELADLCGLTQQTISAVEHRLRVSSVDTLWRLFQGLKLEAFVQPVPDLSKDDRAR